MKPMVVMGTGEHAKVVIELARACGYQVQGCVGPSAPDFGPDFCPYLGTDETFQQAASDAFAFALGVGAMDLRVRLAQMLDEWQVEQSLLVHPTAYISPSAHLGQGTHAMAMAAVQSLANVGRHCLLNTGCIVEHDTDVADFCHLAPGSVLCGGAHVHKQGFVGANATVLPGIVIGQNSIVGAGAVAAKALPAGTTLY